ncbi:MAG: 5-methyltetrahydropteroyltriglutamate--homocysteine S-methyltransferase, partial [Pseudomonadota bacterium]|nr:5-methyltetrahydropteroyltriglutamate--homocysteine S-methyltransferase [Pseudomonadota bacterium]
DRLQLLPGLIETFKVLLKAFKEAGAGLIELYEPALGLDLDPNWIEQITPTYNSLCQSTPILLSTVFSSVNYLAPLLNHLKISGLHLDIVRGPEQLELFLNTYPKDKFLSLGVIDGRNVFKANLREVLQQVDVAHKKIGTRLWLATSCSLLHCPIDIKEETRLDPTLKSWLAFSVQKLEELALLKKGLDQGIKSIEADLRQSDQIAQARQDNEFARNNTVRDRVQSIAVADLNRKSPFPQRKIQQQEKLKLPPLPTTTIGSFPQTADIRKARAAFRANHMEASEYHEFISHEIRMAIQHQNSLGLDVLVHGEAERSDMVEFFAEKLDGFLLTQNGWVQSYGSRCVKPPIIYGDVSRPKPMTVGWTHFAQSITTRPVKGMLTGPITLMGWSFVREDLSREAVLLQLALAVRDEVEDLESAGIGIIQIDEPAFREGLPLRKGMRETWLKQAVNAFRLASSGVSDATQIHTHMCYSEF